MAKRKLSLLDLMAIYAECEYLSDLRYINDSQRVQLAQKLKEVPAKGEDLFDWSDALEYLTSAKCVYSSVDQVKYALIAALSQVPEH